MTPAVSEARAVEGPVKAIAYAVNAAASTVASDLGPTAQIAQPPVPGPRPPNIIITGADDTAVEAEAAAAPTGPPEVCDLCKGSQSKEGIACNDVTAGLQRDTQI